MGFTESQIDRGATFDRTEVAALHSAAQTGWLTLTPTISDRALIAWQHECERTGRAFAVIRLEPKRASLWCLLTDGSEWTQSEQARIHAALSKAIGYVVTSNSVRAFAPLGIECDVMQRLLAANASAS
jgi:hypothetical protein